MVVGGLGLVQQGSKFTRIAFGQGVVDHAVHPPACGIADDFADVPLTGFDQFFVGGARGEIRVVKLFRVAEKRSTDHVVGNRESVSEKQVRGFAFDAANLVMEKRLVWPQYEKHAVELEFRELTEDVAVVLNPP